MSVARLWDGSAWVPAFVGARGPSGVVSSNTPPEDTTVLWADTSEAGDAVVPTGGTTGQSLVKASGSDYDTEWVTINTEVRADFVNPHSYIGVAPLGSLTSESVWNISRINIGPPVVTETATAVEWDDRLTVSYI